MYLIDTEKFIYKLYSNSDPHDHYFSTETDHRLHENYNLAKMIQTFKMHWINFKGLISFCFPFFLLFGSSQITVWVQEKTTKLVNCVLTLWIHLIQLIVAVTVYENSSDVIFISLWLAQLVIQNVGILVWCLQSIACGGKNKADY